MTAPARRFAAHPRLLNDQSLNWEMHMQNLRLRWQGVGPPQSALNALIAVELSINLRVDLMDDGPG